MEAPCSDCAVSCKGREQPWTLVLEGFLNQVLQIAGGECICDITSQ